MPHGFRLGLLQHNLNTVKHAVDSWQMNEACSRQVQAVSQLLELPSVPELPSALTGWKALIGEVL